MPLARTHLEGRRSSFVQIFQVDHFLDVHYADVHTYLLVMDIFFGSILELFTFAVTAPPSYLPLVEGPLTVTSNYQSKNGKEQIYPLQQQKGAE